MAVVFLLYVIVEVAAVWVVASLIGVLATLGLLLAGAVVGSWLARREGGKAFRALVNTANAGRNANAEVTDSMLIGLGGLFILLPGFVTDIVGLLLLLPPTRGPFRRAWVRRIERHGPVGNPMQNPAQNPMRGRVIVVDSEVVQDRRPGDDPPPRIIDAG